VQAIIADLAERYPYSERGINAALQITMGEQVVQHPQVAQGVVWRLSSVDRRTTVGLTDNSLTLETTNYQGREAFSSELRLLTEALLKATRVPAFSRLGVRFTNRLTGFTTGQLQDMINPELFGVVGAADGGPARVAYSLAQAMFAFEPGQQQLLAQWGSLPAGATIDPTLMALSEPSWVLDMDSFTDLNVDLTADEVGRIAEGCAERAYTFFRWAVTNAFLQRFGATP
jgi:uncharacterized protein (TIGR04255 family)